MKQRRILGCLAALTMTLHASAQVPDWNTQGNNITTNEWFGADANSIIPLRIRHDANQPIEWYTDAVQRMQLYQTRTGTLPLLGGGTVNVPQFGYLGLSGTPGFFAANGYGPFSRLHLADADPAMDHRTACALTFPPTVQVARAVGVHDPRGPGGRRAGA